MHYQHRYRYLFSPFCMDGLRLKNRIVGSATVTNLARSDGGVSDRTVAHYATRASGRTALITVEMSAIHPTGRGWFYMLGIWDNRFIPGYKKLVDAIHSYGTKCSLQLGHCGRQTTREIIGTRPVAPSSSSQFPIDHPQYVLPRTLSGSEIKEIIRYTSNAAYRAMQAGFDAIELHAAHGYLFHQFLSPAGNIRDDKYGGNSLNRCGIIIEIIREIRKKCGSNFCITCKIDGNEHIEGGIDLEEATKIARLLEKAGVNAFLVSAGCAASLEYIIPPAHMQSAPNLYEAKEIKKVVRIPVGVVGKIDNLDLADVAIGNGDIDYIALARPLLCDPRLPAKLKQEKWEDIRNCIYCNEKCNRIDDQYAVGCTLNPLLGQEYESGYRLGPPKSKRKVVVVGGGPAGMEASKVAAARGHEVYLLEKNKILGGQLNLASKIPGKETWSTIVPYYERELTRLGVNIEFGKNADIRTLRNIIPEVVAVAIGAAPCLNEIAVSKGAKTATAFEAISNPEHIGNEVVVIGGQRLAVETGLYLAAKGKNVTIVARGKNESYIAQNVTRSVRPYVIRNLHKYDIKIIYKASVIRIGQKNLFLKVNDIYQKLPYKMVVMATYLRPTLLPFLEEIEQMGCAIYRIGDCVYPRGLGTAISEGFGVGQLM